jgi:hypothetical protein
MARTILLSRERASMFASWLIEMGIQFRYEHAHDQYVFWTPPGYNSDVENFIRGSTRENERCLVAYCS